MIRQQTSNQNLQRALKRIEKHQEPIPKHIQEKLGGNIKVDETEIMKQKYTNTFKG